MVLYSFDKANQWFNQTRIRIKIHTNACIYSEIIWNRTFTKNKEIEQKIVIKVLLVNSFILTSSNYREAALMIIDDGV